MIKLFTDIQKVQKHWEKIQVPDFLNIDFLKVYYKKHSQLKHLFFIDDNMRMYAHIFNLTFSKTSNYLQNNIYANILLRLINFHVLYFTNSFITNIPSFITHKSIDLNKLLNTIKENYSMIVIPDFLFNRMSNNEDDFKKIEVEEEMVLDIRNNWNVLEDYIFALRKKYRNKVKKILKETSQLEIRNLGSKQLKNLHIDMKDLFDQVVKSSSFIGPEFDVSSFILFVKQDLMKVNGYFLDNKLIAFSSEIRDDKKLYSYYVGFDKKINNSLPIYGRILIENINNAIQLKKDKLILGRTANEYKSNFGAYPIKSYIYLKVRNKYLHTLLNPIYTRLKINKWKQRHPFKDY